MSSIPDKVRVRGTANSRGYYRITIHQRAAKAPGHQQGSNQSAQSLCASSNKLLLAQYFNRFIIIVIKYSNHSKQDVSSSCHSYGTRNTHSAALFLLLVLPTVTLT